MTFKEFTPSELPLKDRHRLLIGAITPRPIAFAGTLDSDGHRNLSPFSFFNAFGANPVTVGFSPAYSGRTGEPKDTLNNVRATGEFTISIVNHAIVYQMQLAAGEYTPEVDEFELSGLTPLDSLKVSPPGVAESPVVLECTLQQIIEMGGEKGSGNLILGEVVQYRIAEEVLDDQGLIDPVKLDSVGRLGGSWYTRVREGLFSIDRKQTDVAAGFAILPEELLTSTILTGNELAQLASVAVAPTVDAITGPVRAKYSGLTQDQLHYEIQGLLEDGHIEMAWMVVVMGEG